MDKLSNYRKTYQVVKKIGIILIVILLASWLIASCADSVHKEQAIKAEQRKLAFSESNGVIFVGYGNECGCGVSEVKEGEFYPYIKNTNDFSVRVKKVYFGTHGEFIHWLEEFKPGDYKYDNLTSGYGYYILNMDGGEIGYVKPANNGVLPQASRANDEK